MKYTIITILLSLFNTMCGISQTIPDKFKYRSFTSVGIGGGVLGVSGQIVKMNYYYIGDVNHFDLSVFKGPSIDAEISAGEGIIGGAAVSIMKSQIYAGEYLIGIGGFLGAGVGAPVSGSITWQNTVYFDKNTQR